MTQGYRVGEAKVNDKLFVINDGNTFSADILMENGIDNSLEFEVTSVNDSKLTIGTNHRIKTGEKMILISDSGDYQKILPHIVYYAIAFSTSPNADKIKLASTKTDADKGIQSQFLVVQNLEFKVE